MAQELVQSTAQTEDMALIYLESATKKIKESINTVSNEFFYIGYHLWEVDHFGRYKAKGYKTIVEYAEKELNFKKRSTYNFIGIVNKFADFNGSYPKMCINEKFKGYGYTQLTEMLSLAPEQLENVKSDMTIKEIRNVKKEREKEINVMLSNVFDKLENENEVIETEFLEVNQDDPVAIGIEKVIVPDKIVVFYEEELKQLKNDLENKTELLDMQLSQLQKDKVVLQDQLKASYARIEILENDSVVSFLSNNKIYQIIKDKANYYRVCKRYNWAKELEDLILKIENELNID